ncbi:MAG TPA: FAD-dependent oxidoreductase [Bryobacteraceae bacterium]|nr:FAD-dependent oxidoreductase [Bryobacteraceae bacterium]
MSHSPLHSRLLRTLNAALQEPRSRQALSRRGFLQTLGGAALVQPAAWSAPAVSHDVAIVGAGLAGLSCAYELKKAGVRAPIYEASDRAGGRCHSLAGFFPGQVAERGGELIDNLHKTMIGYAREFGLTLEDVGKMPGEVRYHLDGRDVPESVIVEEFRAFVPAMRADLRRLSPEPTADSHNEADKQLDYLNLRQYLETRRAGRLISKAIEEAYVAEYGRELDDQSCLNLLLFIHADRRSRFTPFGVFSDERYHIVEGNDGIARGLANRLPGQIVPCKQLAAVKPASDGRLRLIFSNGSWAEHGAVVLTCPFSVLRNIDLKDLKLPKWKTDAINGLGYGENAKLMIGFTRPQWRDLNCNGSSYSDLADHQATWETNPTLANGTRAVLTDYSGGNRGRNYLSEPLQVKAARFLGDLDRVMPGVHSSARRDKTGSLMVHLEHWPSNAFSRGSYTCYQPGQFTSIAGNEGKPVGNLYFAGEHTNSFYEWQGFMEGALLSGIQAAADIVRKKR